MLHTKSILPITVIHIYLTDINMALSEEFINFVYNR